MYWYWLTRLGLVLMGYCFGLISTGLILAKIKGVDLKHTGSGNTGATNTLRAAGAKAGLIVLLGDCIKCVIPMLIVRLIFKDNVDVRTLMFYAGMGCILGHNFPFYAHFKGGKGVSSTLGLALMLDPIAALICLAFFALIVFLTRYVSLGSILAETALFLWFIIKLFVFGGFKAMTVMGSVEFVCLGLLMVLLCIIQHRANIERLVNGNENKIFDKKKENTEETNLLEEK